MENYIQIIENQQPVIRDQFTAQEREFVTLYEQWERLPDGDDKFQVSRQLIRLGTYLGVYPQTNNSYLK